MDAILDAFRLMGLASWIVVGLAAAAIARFGFRSRAAAGCFVSGVVGVVGALVGGLLATYLGFGGLSGFDLRGFVIACLGAAALLMLLRALGRPPIEDR